MALMPRVPRIVYPTVESAGEAGTHTHSTITHKTTTILVILPAVARRLQRYAAGEAAQPPQLPDASCDGCGADLGGTGPRAPGE